MGNAGLYDVAKDPGVEMLEELLRWSIRAEDPLPRAVYLPKVAPHGWYARTIPRSIPPVTRRPSPHPRPRPDQKAQGMEVRLPAPTA